MGWKNAVAAAAMVVASVGVAHATIATQNVDGIVFPVGVLPGGNQIQSGVIDETAITGTGQSLTGIGIVNSIGPNSLTNTWQSGDNGVMLAFVFHNYISDIVTAPTGSTSGVVTFTGGDVEFYVLAAGTNIDQGSVAADVSAVQAGTLWLAEKGALSCDPGSLAACNANDTLISTIPTGNSLTQFIGGQGEGFLDVTGGDAGAAFHTLTFANAADTANGGYSDQSLTSDFTSGVNAAGFQISGSATVKANAIPEPASVGLLGLGLLGLGVMRRRQAQT